jgi:UDP-N-acetylmuramoylalanine-D-glutamate ligase
MRHAPAILIGRTVRTLARIRKPGGGSAIPGLVVNRFAPGFLFSVLNTLEHGVVIVSGSSGKSTTTKMLVAVLREHGRRVFTNDSTANISQGLTSSVLERVDLRGRLSDSMAVLELDEAHGAAMVSRLVPRTVVLTNVMTDQIDRFQDSAQVADLLARIASRATESLVYNADDAFLAEIAAGSAVTTVGFGVNPEVRASLRRGLGYASEVAHRGPVDAEVTALSGLDVTVTVAKDSATLRLPARGAHYAVDAAAAIAAAAALLGPEFDARRAADAISAIEPVFARGEITEVRGKPVEFVLVQNPGSFQLNVDELDPALDQVFIAVGSDVRDPSYLWSADLTAMPPVLIASGSKAHELALQLLYNGVAVDEIDPDLPAAIDRFLALPSPRHGLKTVIFTADSMRRVRGHLGLAQ